MVIIMSMCWRQTKWNGRRKKNCGSKKKRRRKMRMSMMKRRQSQRRKRVKKVRSKECQAKYTGKIFVDF